VAKVLAKYGILLKILLIPTFLVLTNFGFIDRISHLILKERWVTLAAFIFVWGLAASEPNSTRSPMWGALVLLPPSSSIPGALDNSVWQDDCLVWRSAPAAPFFAGVPTPGGAFLALMPTFAEFSGLLGNE